MTHCPAHKHIHPFFSRSFIGLALIAAGALLFAFNAGLLPAAYKDVVFSWPALLLLLGLGKVIQGKHIFFGLILSGIGLHLLSPRLGFLIPDLGNVTLPIFLVILGIALLVHRKSENSWFPQQKFHEGRPLDINQDGRIDENNIFGGSKRVLRDTVFRGGEINCVFGGSELDLTGADLAEGTSYLDIHCVFGGVTILVPEDWVIRIQVSSFFGDFSDTGKVPPERKDPSRTLVITGSCVFGGGEIRYQARS